MHGTIIVYMVFIQYWSSCMLHAGKDRRNVVIELKPYYERVIILYPNHIHTYSIIACRLTLHRLKYKQSIIM